MQVTTAKIEHVPLPPIIGAIALVGGIVLLSANPKKVFVSPPVKNN